MSNKLLEEAVGHLRYWLPQSLAATCFTSDEYKQWKSADKFLSEIDMKIDEENAKHQDVLREVSDQQCFKMSEVHNEKFPLQKRSPADFRAMINMMLSISLVLDGEL